MCPSSAQHFFEEQQAHNAVATAAVAQAAAAAAAAATTTEIALERGMTVSYATEALTIPEVACLEGGCHYDLPGTYASAVSVIVQVGAGERSAGDRNELGWWLTTSIDGTLWTSLAPAGGSVYRRVGARESSGARLHGPFGARLRINMQPLTVDAFGRYDWGRGAWRDIEIRVGAQFPGWVAMS
ncbi:hypothetical protein [Cellulomonas hominis]|uniref:hypothetical protein n=1 Tax=Cellulomonas hominis TaxID=156981 RepID=UPI001443B675|nr:hypothetical protein [Cellulomonas hominis]NKY08929.1 hypothetical protein [Cellulomonas hominis]